MKKRLIAWIVVILVVWMLFPTGAGAAGSSTVPETDGGMCGKNLKWSINTKTGVLTISGSGDMYDYKMNSGEEPPWYLSYWKYIKKVDLKSGVTHIGNHAFSICRELTTVSLPNTLKSIGVCAFDSCRKLESVNMPDSVESVGANAFNSCIALSRVTLSKNLKKIPANAFRACAMEYIILPEGLENIAEHAFLECTKLKEVVFPSSLKILDIGAFMGCSSLKEVVIPDTLPNMYSSVFTYCKNLESITLPYYFIGKVKPYESKINTVHVTRGNPESDGIMTDYFDGNLEDNLWGALRDKPFSVVIDEGIKQLGKRTFFHSEKMTAITLPSSLERVCTQCFCACYALKDVYYMGTKAEFETKLKPQIEYDNEPLLNATWHFYLDSPRNVNGKISLGGSVQWKGSTPYVVYDGLTKKPVFTVKDQNGKTIDPFFYDFKYENNRTPGTARIKVTFKGGYVGSCSATFKIYLPATVKTAVENVKDGIRISWSPVEGAKGYVIYRRAWNLKSKGWTTFERWNNTTQTSWTDTKVYAGTRYQYGVKAYPKDAMDNYNLGIVGPLKTTVRITTRTLNSVTPGSKRITVKWAGSKVFTGYEIRVATNDTFTAGVKTVTVPNAGAFEKVVTGLKAKKTYYVEVRSYQEFEGMTYYGQWSNVLSCKTP